VTQHTHNVSDCLALGDKVVFAASGKNYTGTVDKFPGGALWLDLAPSSDYGQQVACEAVFNATGKDKYAIAELAGVNAGEGHWPLTSTLGDLTRFVNQIYYLLSSDNPKQRVQLDLTKEQAQVIFDIVGLAVTGPTQNSRRALCDEIWHMMRKSGFAKSKDEDFNGKIEFKKKVEPIWKVGEVWRTENNCIVKIDDVEQYDDDEPTALVEVVRQSPTETDDAGRGWCRYRISALGVPVNCGLYSTQAMAIKEKL
jgi:hypothetical protein